MPMENQLLALFEAWKPSVNSHSKWKAMTDLVCYFIAKGMLTYDTVLDSNTLSAHLSHNANHLIGKLLPTTTW